MIMMLMMLMVFKIQMNDSISTSHWCYRAVKKESDEIKR